MSRCYSFDKYIMGDESHAEKVPDLGMLPIIEHALVRQFQGRSIFVKIKIHRGTQQIGGTCTEIRSNNGKRIIIDVGAELPSTDRKKERHLRIPGVTSEATENNPKCSGIFITHNHGDHIGEVKNHIQGVNVFMGKASKELYSILMKRLYEASKIIIEKKIDKIPIVTEEEWKRIKEIKTFDDYKKVCKNDDIKVTPIRTDHSAFDSYMFLIEADGQRVLHTGDFRSHGYYGDEYLKDLENILKGERLDVLICEGTMLSRSDADTTTEAKLKEKAEAFFKDNKNVFVLCSSMNIDAISSFYQAAIKNSMLFVVDEFQDEVLEAVKKFAGDKSVNELPSETREKYDFCDYKVYKKDACFYCKAGETGCHRCSNNTFLKSNRDSNEELLKQMKAKGFCMLVRANKSGDKQNGIDSPKPKPTLFEKVMQQFSEHHLIYSIWSGYLDDKKPWYNENFSELIKLSCEVLGAKKDGDNFEGWHTGGHATKDTIEKLIEKTQPKFIIPIHGEDSYNFEKLGMSMGSVKHMIDRQTYDIDTNELSKTPYEKTLEKSITFSALWQPMRNFHLRPTTQGATIVCTIDKKDIAMRGRKKGNFHFLSDKSNYMKLKDFNFSDDESIKSKLSGLCFEEKGKSKKFEKEFEIQARFINLIYDNPDALVCLGKGFSNAYFIASEFTYGSVANKVDVIAECEDYILVVEIKQGADKNEGDSENQLSNYMDIYFGKSSYEKTCEILRNYPNHKLTKNKKPYAFYLLLAENGGETTMDMDGQRVVRYRMDGEQMVILG